MITLCNATIEYEKFKLGPINLQINDGEFISVVGPSGSGKSTLIKTITNNLKVLTGTIEYDACTSNDIMYISQMGTTFNHLSVRENLNLKYTYSDDEILNSLVQVGLSKEYIEKYPFELSGGERQRIDLVRALLSKSKYIVLDESMSALDSVNKQAISKLLKSFVESNQISIIYITHDVMQAIEYSSRIVSINDGTVIFDGTSDEYIMMKEGD